jgi:hypothetical protein
MLYLALFILAVACLLPRPSNEALSIAGFQIPEICLLRRTVGVDCPGCGLTRSFVSMGHGYWFEAWSFNRIGPIFFLLVAFQVPYRVFALSGPGRHLKNKRWNLAIPVIFLLLVINWLMSRFI